MLMRVSPIAAMCLATVMGTACREARPAQPAAVRSELSAPPARPQLLYVSVASDDTFRRVAVVPLAAPTSARFVTPLQCQRVYFNGTHGICLTSTLSGVTSSWWGEVFNERFESVARVELTGEPSRVRVSPDGTLAAATVFEEGHSYADHRFSTRTSLTKLPSGQSLGDLEQFVTFKDGKRVTAVDVNFWGVSFARDSDTFYATLDTAGVSYLVRGSVAQRRMDVVYTGIECPSLSPDNTQIAFKKRIGARERGWWQVAVLNLQTMKEHLVSAEARSVDDQVEWLDNDRVIYHLTDGSTAADLWVVRVDNTAKPELLVPAAYSPAVVR
ncbi:MAG: TolB-like translocation protein [Vicinamibacterales bacterium]